MAIIGVSADNLSIIIIIISIQPEGRLWQEPEPSQATGMTPIQVKNVTA